jgi:uncharacterized protein (DUF1501 family)
VIDRRQLLGAGLSAFGAASGALTFPNMAFAKGVGEKRFIFIMQRGAADGLSTVIPTGDPALAAARAAFLDEAPVKLDGLFSLHPAMARTAGLYAAKEALFVHGVATPYRERSHFDAQNILETGGEAAYAMKTGWMNRLIALLPTDGAKAIAFSPTIPLALRGSATVASFAPSALPDASPDLIARVPSLYDGDPQLKTLWKNAVETRGMAGATTQLNSRDAAAAGALAAKMMAGTSGARIAMIETNGWDTHSGQKGRMANQLKGLDALLGALKDGLAAHWAETLVIVATEFGRTVAVNGTGGTDHGTASAAMMIGGAVKGGRVVSDWPGLRTQDLFEGRDLRPTLGLDQMFVGALGEHYSLDRAIVRQTLFPTLPKSRPLEGFLMR